MELLKVIRRRSFLAETVYVVLNIALAIAVLLIVRSVESPVPALLLVLLSKWRVLAVRPRYWIANIQANFVDFIVSLSVVMLMYSTSAMGQSAALIAQLLLTALYILWLVVIKPRSSRRMMVMQAAGALVIGTMALFVVSYDWPIELVVLGMAVIGYVTARHALTQYEEDHLQFMALLWAFTLAQVGWVLYHWVIAYSIPLFEARIPQAVFVVTALAVIVFKVYDSYKTHDTVRPVDVALPIGFSVAIVAILLIAFNQPPIGAL